MKRSGWRWVGLAVATAGLHSACLISDIEDTCEALAVPAKVAGVKAVPGEPHALVIGAGGGTIVGFTHESTVAGRITVAAVLANPATGELDRHCGPDSVEEGVDLHEVSGPGSISSSPALARATLNDDLVGLAYRRSTGVSDEIRLAFLSAFACRVPTDQGNATILISENDDTRRMETPLVVGFGRQRFAVIWLSSARDDLLFDDRIRGRLVSPVYPRYPSSSIDVLGGAVDLDIPGRYLRLHAVIPMTEQDGVGRFAIVWYERGGMSGKLFVRVFDEEFRPLGAARPFAEDRDQTSALKLKRVSGVYEPGTNSFVLAWTRGTTGDLVGVQAQVFPADPLLNPGPVLDLGVGGDVSAWDPTVGFLDQDVLVAWKQVVPGSNSTSEAQLRAALVRRSGVRRFTRAGQVGCGASAFPLGTDADAEIRAPSISAIGTKGLVLSWNRDSRRGGPLPDGSLGALVITKADLVPKGGVFSEGYAK